jgi:UV DNA damage endonuclease
MRGTSRVANLSETIDIIPLSDKQSNIFTVCETVKTNMLVSSTKPIQLGLCCLNTTLRAQKPSIFASRKMIQRTIKTKGIEELKKKILQNVKDVLKMMHWNEMNGIKVFRLSSEMFPHKTNPNVEDYDYDFTRDTLKQIGELSKIYSQRLTFHPGQYNVVGSPHEDKFLHTCNDLKYHADVLDLMGCDKHSVIVVHAGGYYGDKPATKKRWCDNFQRLSENVKARLVIENCEKSFSIEDCLEVSEKINIPVVFDTHHYNCYCLLHPDETFSPPGDYIPQILKTWERRGIKPKFHVSEQGSGRCGHHSDYIEVIPAYLMEIPEKYGVNIDIMIEAKKKELAIKQLYLTYPNLNCLIDYN